MICVKNNSSCKNGSLLLYTYQLFFHLAQYSTLFSVYPSLALYTPCILLYSPSGSVLYILLLYSLHTCLSCAPSALIQVDNEEEGAGDENAEESFTGYQDNMENGVAMEEDQFQQATGYHHDSFGRQDPPQNSKWDEEEDWETKDQAGSEFKLD